MPRPPRNPPDELLAAYTLNGSVAYERVYIDDTDDGAPTHYAYPAAEVDIMLRSAHGMVASHSGAPRQDAPAGARSAASLLVEAVVSTLALAGAASSAVVFGSQDPWAECLLLALGASAVTTVDYNDLTYEHPALRTMSVAALEEQLDAPTPPAFDLAVSLSSFDHDGLGRYGDRLSPEGDLRAMATAWRALRPGGHLLLTVPVGPDALVWNLHRRYGRRRLPLLLAGWEETARLDWEARRLDELDDELGADSVAALRAFSARSYEPMFVLRRNGSAADGLRNEWALRVASASFMDDGNAAVEQSPQPVSLTGQCQDRAPG